MKENTSKVTGEEHKIAIEATETLDYFELLKGQPKENLSPIVRKELELSEKKNQSKNSSILYNALDLYKLEEKDTPKLLDPFLQKVGLAAIVGSSDTGKSSFLRQLALSIALGKEDFLGFKINPETHNVIYVSTEDDKYSTTSSIKKQLSELTTEDKIDNLEHLDFIFETENLLTSLKVVLNDKKVDLIVIDAFADVFTKEINSNTQVRAFLNQYHKLATQHECLIIFLHHLGKRAENQSPSKNSIIGSQAFEAKMRSVLDLRNSNNNDFRKLTLVKCNFLSSDYKKESYLLKFNKNLVFENTNQRVTIHVNSKKIPKKDNPKIVKRVLALRNEEKLSIRKIEDMLKDTELEASKNTINKIIKANS